MATQIAFGLYDVTAKADSSPTATDKQPFVDMSDLLLDELEAPKYATLEQDLFLLDGSFELFPDAPAGLEWGLWSLSMSDASGAFANPPMLAVGFTENHSSLGLTLHFSPATGDWASEVRVRWYDAADNLITTALFHPDRAVCFLEHKVDNYRRLEIDFLKTSKPYRYLKLAAIDYGLTRVFEGDELVNARVLEEVDILSAQISINTLEFQLHSNNANFSILNPKGVFSLLQQRQRLDVTQLVNGEPLYIGAYFLDEWENSTENDIKMKAVDWIGLLDKTTFYGGIYEGVTASDLISEILDETETPYELDPSLADVEISGHVPICTHREALQQVAFAIGAVVDCSRSEVVKLYPAPERPSVRISYGRKFIGQTLKLKPMVTGVDVTAHKYSYGTEATELFKDELEPGEYEIVFLSPAHDLAITGGSILESNANYARIGVTVAGEVVLTGKEYINNQQVIRKRMANLPAGTAPNVLSIKEATLVSPALARDVASRVFDYYQLRHENEFEMLTQRESVSDMVVVDSMNRERLRGMIESLDIDLTGGFLAKTKVVGVRIETTSGYYTGELYAGDQIGVI
jgi:hypothetical protein